MLLAPLKGDRCCYPAQPTLLVLTRGDRLADTMHRHAVWLKERYVPDFPWKPTREEP